LTEVIEDIEPASLGPMGRHATSNAAAQAFGLTAAANYIAVPDTGSGTLRQTIKLLQRPDGFATVG
jgi:hypothetical protein